MFTSVVLPHLHSAGRVWKLERLDSIKQETDAPSEHGGWETTQEDAARDVVRKWKCKCDRAERVTSTEVASKLS